MMKARTHYNGPKKLEKEEDYGSCSFQNSFVIELRRKLAEAPGRKQGEGRYLVFVLLFVLKT